MSFQNKDFFMAINEGRLIDEEANQYEITSRNESKHDHQWFTGPCEQEILYSKRQAIERATGSDTSMSFLYRDYRSSSQPVQPQYIDNLSGPDHIMNCINNDGGNISPSGAENLIRKGNGFVNGVGNPLFANYSNGYNILSTDQSLNKADGRFVRENGGDGIISVGPTHKGDCQAYSRSGVMISSYDLLMTQGGHEYGHNPLVGGNDVPNVRVAPTVATPKSVTLSKKKGKKEAKKLSTNSFPSNVKKLSTNSFPSNVKTLLSTGIFDGVPVMYVSWSRDKKLQGVIKGTGYLCGCKDCNRSSVLNAFEFERHAGVKTKHPNNHIYFANGKTIYAVVQELKSTPKNLLFEVITKASGSPVNQPKFDIWKASYLAATCELSRISGNREGTVPS